VKNDTSTDHFLIAIGGFVGFTGVLISALGIGGDDISTALWKAACGMIIGAGLVKLLLMIAHSAFNESRREKTAKAMQAVAQKEAAAQPTAPGQPAQPDAASATGNASNARPASTRASRRNKTTSPSQTVNH
jgi:predicted lipid-binding transport protein (Tim44 family)